MPPPSVKVHDVRFPWTVNFPYPHVQDGLFSWVIANLPRSKTNTQWPQFSGKYSGADALRSVSIVHTPLSFVVVSPCGLWAARQPGTTAGGAATSRLRRSIAWM